MYWNIIIAINVFGALALFWLVPAGIAASVAGLIVLAILCVLRDGRPRRSPMLRP